MASPPRVLVSWHESPGYIAPPRLSPRQVSAGPRLEGDPEGLVDLVTPPGRYDLHDLVLRGGIDPVFDVVAVSADMLMRNRPQNLGAFGCPVVLLAGDTHHGKAPLRRVVAYAQSEPFDLVVVCHTRQHMHWYAEAGLPRVAWLPGLLARHLPQPPGATRRPVIAFVGQSGGLHPRRRHLLERLQAEGLPLARGTARREQAAAIYGRAAIGFNASLNGDFNMRVCEVLSAGACLLTDRLGPSAGMGLVLEEGRHHAAYGSAEELVAEARALLADPARARALAAAGHARYLETLAPDRQAARLLDWAAGGAIEPGYAADADERSARRAPGADLVRRMKRYELLQERQRLNERVAVDIGPEGTADDMLDLADLHRVVLCLAPDATAARAAATRAFRLGARIELRPTGSLPHRPR